MSRLKTIATAGSLALVLCFVHGMGDVLIPLVHAATLTFPNGTDQQITDMMAKIIIVMDVLTWIVFTFLNFLLDTEFIFGGTGGNLLQLLNEIWQLARDLMNIIFALILVGAAIYTIITAKKEFLSEHGPKFVMAVILVNFSWFFPMVVIDVANVGTAAVYGIPSMLNNNPAAQCNVTRTTPPALPTLPPLPSRQCTAVAGQANTFTCPCMGVTDVQFFIETEAQLATYQEIGYTCPLGQVLCYKQQVLDMNAVAPYSGVLNGLVINHARLAQLAQVPQPSPAAGPNPTGRMLMWIIKMAVVLIIHVALLFPLLAMTIAFMIRIPVLWITIAFMPFYFLDFLMGGTFEQFTQGYGKKILTTFMKAAFLPLLVAVPLSIGFLLLNAATQLTGGSLAGIPIRLFDQVNNFWQLLWLFMSLGVIWVGVFIILKGDDIMSMGAQTIKGYGESLGRIALKAPLAIPTIPGSNGGAAKSYLGVLHGLNPRTLESAMNSGTPMQGALKGAFGVQPNSQSAEKAAKDIRGNQEVERQLRDSALQAHTDADRLAELVKLLADRGMGTTNANVGDHIQQIQRAGVGLGTNGANMTPAQIKAIQEHATKRIADDAAAKKKKQEEAEAQANNKNNPN